MHTEQPLQQIADMPQLKPKTLRSAQDHHDTDEARLRDAIETKLTYDLGKRADTANDHDWYQATVLAVRDRVVDVWMQSREQTKRQHKKRVYYLSIEFLIGRLLFDTLINLRLVEPARRALARMGVDLDRLRRVEPDAALGNGGLGRLAACFMDSMSALGIPAYGYGIRYENGLFEQRIRDGWQQEFPEDWLAHGNPWEFAARRHGLSGRLRRHGRICRRRRSHRARDLVSGRRRDRPCPTTRRSPAGAAATSTRCGFGRRARRSRCNLRRSIDGDIIGATDARARAEAISRVLYPNDSTPEGKELRLRQEYFFTAASLQDLIAPPLAKNSALSTLWPITPRSSSTTRIRPSRSPN